MYGFLFFHFSAGKRVETIKKQWHQVFVDAAWHQPAVILFDDLDQIVSAPSVLQEMGGEALYKQRLAQGRGDKAMVVVACRLNQNEKD